MSFGARNQLVRQVFHPKVGRAFGPITLMWFTALALLGITQIGRYPEVILAVNPLHELDFFVRNGWHGFLMCCAQKLNR